MIEANRARRAVSRWYLDASAALELVVQEAESGALVAAIDEEQPDLVACALLETEVRRAAQQSPALTQAAASALLDGISLYEVPTSLFREAGLVTGTHLRSLDALHLAAAIRIGAEAVITYGARMGAAARDAGLVVLAPR